jgi:hypothetical protein
MPSRSLTEVRAVASQSVAAGGRHRRPFIRHEILSARENKRLRPPSGGGPMGGGGIGAFVQIAARWTGSQTHDEHLISAGEQWLARREQLASSGALYNHDHLPSYRTAFLKVYKAHGH